jgi:glutamyl-tRNA reductase
MSSLVVVGVNHRTAPVETRERLAVDVDNLDEVLKSVRALEGVQEAMLLATCNRVEVYAAGDDPEVVTRALRSFFDRRGASGQYLYELRGDAGAGHAFRVCASLDSLVVGEPQILGQVKEAWQAARAAGTVGPLLNRLMTRALQAAKRVRTETGIGDGKVSVASVAVDLARGIFGDLEGRRVVLVGAGKMALGAARSLVRHGASLAIVNRSYEKALLLAQEHGAVAHPLTDLTLLLQHGDVVVCSTGAARYVVTYNDVAAAMKERRGRSLFFIDIAVPRNVDPRVGDLDNVYLYNVDDLEQIVAEGTSTRATAKDAAEKLILEEVDAWRRERRVQGVVPVITALRQKFRATAMGELERTLGRSLKHLTTDDRKALEVMIDATINKILHAPTTALKARVDTPEGAAAAEVLRELFDLHDPPDASP